MTFPEKTDPARLEYISQLLVEIALTHEKKGGEINAEEKSEVPLSSIHIETG